MKQLSFACVSLSGTALYLLIVEQERWQSRGRVKLTDVQVHLASNFKFFSILLFLYLSQPFSAIIYKVTG